MLKANYRILFLNDFDAVNWTLNFNYWTGGTQTGLFGQWSWCKQGHSPERLVKDLVWDTGEPDNKGGKEDCVHLRIGRNGTPVKLTDKNCSSLLIFACQVR